MERQKRLGPSWCSSMVAQLVNLQSLISFIFFPQQRTKVMPLPEFTFLPQAQRRKTQGRPPWISPLSTLLGL